MLWWLRIRASFFCLESCLIAYSLFIASCFVSYSSKYTSSTGRRFFVYLAPFPLLCASSLFLRLFVQPVYRVSSLHFTMYVFLDVGFVCQFLSLSFTNYRFSIVFFFTFLLFYPSAFFMIFFYSLSIQTFYYFLPLLFIASTLLFDSLPQNILLSFATTSCHNQFCDLV